MSVSPLTRRAVDLYDHPGLFVVRLERPSGMPAVVTTLEPARPRGRTRVAPTDGHKSGLNRYCSGCAHETEHVAWAREGRGSIPSIRWPAAELPSGTTICLNCGQWRAATSRPRPPAWSRWPRRRVTTRSLADAVDSAAEANDWVSETAAENEGMPPRREPRRPRRSSARLRRVRHVAR